MSPQALQSPQQNDFRVIHRGARRKLLPVGDRGDETEQEDLNGVAGQDEVDGVVDAKIQAIIDGPMRSELKHLDKKVTDKGKIYYTETVDEVIPHQIDWNGKYALSLVRHFRHKNDTLPFRTTLQINSEHLKGLLERTIVDYPGQSFSTKAIEVMQPYHVLFYYRRQIEEAGRDFAPASDAAAHVRLLVEFINEQFKDTIRATDNLLEQGRISYEHLWTIFPPGAIVYGSLDGQPRAFRLDNGYYNCDPPGYMLKTSYVDFDGSKFGTAGTTSLVGAFSGDVEIASLSTFPIQWHPRPDMAHRYLIERGIKWERYAGMHYAYCRGVARSLSGDKYSVNGRVVIDAKTTHRLNGNEAFSVVGFSQGRDLSNDILGVNRIEFGDGKDSALSSDEESSTNVAGEQTNGFSQSDKSGFKPLTNLQRLLASSSVRGFCFSEKQWMDFSISDISPIHWNPNCFDKLVLPHTQKDLVQALVATHAAARNDGGGGFDDIVKGKGKGLIMVLHGPPGVGKTLTAETVAEFTKRPLYMVSSGDLGSYSNQLDGTLSRILDMASTWKAVLLIDEADVFLERRSLHDMDRNATVSIFLRVLEYYEGVLFLTSNRVNTFDDAFKSRIHVPLKYNNLTYESRRAIWKNFLQQMGDDEVELDETGYDSVAQAELNGRQIKNAIRTAKSLGEFHGRKIGRATLEQVIGIQMEFEKELSLTSGDDV